MLCFAHVKPVFFILRIMYNLIFIHLLGVRIFWIPSEDPRPRSVMLMLFPYTVETHTTDMENKVM